jgi:DNA repair protein RadC
VLLRVDGMGEAAVARSACLRPGLPRGTLGWQALLDICRPTWRIERVRVLHLNIRNMLIRDETISEGSIDQSAVHVREVVKRAMELGSASIILVITVRAAIPSPAGRTSRLPTRSSTPASHSASPSTIMSPSALRATPACARWG